MSPAAVIEGIGTTGRRQPVEADPNGDLYLSLSVPSSRRWSAVLGCAAVGLFLAASIILVVAQLGPGAVISTARTQASPLPGPLAAWRRKPMPPIAASWNAGGSREALSHPPHSEVTPGTTQVRALGQQPPPVRTAGPPVIRTHTPTEPEAGCSAALVWLAGHAAPGFRFECPGYALGHQAMTCADVPGVCPGARVIVISDPCPAAYMNEASNSWVVLGLRPGPIDPYGYCH